MTVSMCWLRLAGLILSVWRGDAGAASCGLPVVLDGFLSYSAALAASQIAPQIKPYLIPSHFSAEKGARTALAHLELILI